MTLLAEVTPSPSITSFTFDLPLPAALPIDAFQNKLERRLAKTPFRIKGFLASADGQGTKTVEFKYCKGRSATVELLREGSTQDARAIRITLSLADIEQEHLRRFGKVVRSMLRSDFHQACSLGRATSMTFHVELYNVTLERALPRFKAARGQAVERRKHFKDSTLKRIGFETVRSEGTAYTWGAGSIFDEHDAHRVEAARSANVVHAPVLRQIVREAEKHTALLVVDQQYSLDHPLTGLNHIQCNLHRLDFAENPFNKEPELPAYRIEEFFELVKSEGIDAAMAKSRWWDGGMAARLWWKSRQAEWWNAAEVWDECVLDLPAIGRFIASGFSERFALFE